MAIRFTSTAGYLTIYNIYNDCNHNNSLFSLSAFLITNPPIPTDHMIWLGDFNHHHPLWETFNNRHLNSSENDIQPLLNLLQDYDMELIFPPGIPTFETVTHNWTRPDNVWLSHHGLNLIHTCNTDPTLRPILADHLPIITIVDLPLDRAPVKNLPNFHKIDFAEFNKSLRTHLEHDSPALLITSEEGFHNKVNQLIAIIQATINSTVPIRKPCPYSKRWWNTDLTTLKKKKSRLSNKAHKFRDIINHPAIEEHKKVTKEFALAINNMAKAHWIDWLENISAQQIYTANKYVTNEPTDFSSARIPTLKTDLNGIQHQAISNPDKVQALSTSFFPPPPTTNSISENFEYPPRSQASNSSQENVSEKPPSASNPSRPQALMGSPTSFSPNPWTYLLTTSSIYSELSSN